jgi:hypothetical protein
VKKITLFIVLLLLMAGAAYAQGGKLLALKERGIIVRSFTSGSYIKFKFINQQWITGYVDWIKEDSIQINQFAIQPVMSSFGTYAEDTLKVGPIRIHVKEIIGFAQEKGHYTSVFTNGALLQVAGPLYAGLNISNSIIKKDPVFSNRNLPQIAGGVVAWILGNLQRKAHPNYRPIGKRFSVEII